jgi:hypothetical protein
VTAFTATAIGLAVVATLLFVTAVALFFQWDIPTAWKELKGQTFTDTVEALTKALSSEGAVESYRKLAALSLTEASPFSNQERTDGTLDSDSLSSSLSGDLTDPEPLTLHQESVQEADVREKERLARQAAAPQAIKPVEKKPRPLPTPVSLLPDVPAPAPVVKPAQVTGHGDVAEEADTGFFPDESEETTEEADTTFFEDAEIPAANLTPQPPVEATDPLSHVTLVSEAHSWQ